MTPKPSPRPLPVPQDLLYGGAFLTRTEWRARPGLYAIPEPPPNLWERLQGWWGWAR